MKTAAIEVANSHFFGFPTQVTMIRHNEVTPLVAELVGSGEWLELVPFPPDRWALRVKTEVIPLVAMVREQLP